MKYFHKILFLTIGICTLSMLCIDVFTFFFDMNHSINIPERQQIDVDELLKSYQNVDKHNSQETQEKPTITAYFLFLTLVIFKIFKR